MTSSFSPKLSTRSRVTKRLPPNAVAVVDTNVVMDMRSCADLVQEYERGASDLAAARTPEAIFRRARVRESMILAWYLHKVGAVTFSLPDESVRILTRMADPSAARDFGTHFTTWFIWFVKDYVLDRWYEGFVPGIDTGLKGSDCDDLLVELCCASHVPLITNEGYTLAGVSASNPKGLRAKALAAGVSVYTPRQFWSGRIGPGSACRQFLKRFDKQARRFLHGFQRGTPVVGTLGHMQGYYAHVFFGLTSADVRLAVEIESSALPPR
jgi:hypothetical protein